MDYFANNPYKVKPPRGSDQIPQDAWIKFEDGPMTWFGTENSPCNDIENLFLMDGDKIVYDGSALYKVGADTSPWNEIGSIDFPELVGTKLFYFQEKEFTLMEPHFQLKA